MYDKPTTTTGLSYAIDYAAPAAPPSLGDMLRAVTGLLHEMADATSRQQSGDMITADEVADITGYKLGTVYKKAATGEIPSAKMGGKRVFSRAKAIAIAQGKPAPDIAAQADAIVSQLAIKSHRKARR